ncbi:hypothetical protein SUGI_0747240 [Cryptomeria japonica]|uniref:DEAD-box ATP-dependent RNA helicase 31 n=1 Tax=Cryptomeria japonica TaxID=3369 RepID=UPI0024149961|nr:DEAD-box ATP-dependent RNA helicase 31 [Cryptomeria japonica]GLJ36945.1 hypothetical protein SUGI_0747240 [Cryptomeria japonica]
MLGTGLRARLVYPSTSKLNIWSIPLNQRFAFIGLRKSGKSRQQQRGSISVMAVRSYSGRPPLRSGRGSGNESSPFSSRRSNPPSKTLVEREIDVDKWFDKRDGSMPKRRRDGDWVSNGASASSKGRGRGTRPGEGDWKKASRRALETSDDDEDDDNDRFEKRDVSRSALGRDNTYQRLGKKNSNASTIGKRPSEFFKKGSAASSASLALELSEDEDEDDDDGDSEFASNSDDEEFDAANVLQRSQPKSSDAEKSAPKPKPMPTNAESKGESYLSLTRFEDCNISPLSLRAIKDVGYERMTIVQEATLPSILKGKDVLAKAKTGTGKTVAFLLPAIEVILKSPPISRDERRPPIFVLVICPTRELAGQAAAEAESLLKYHANIGVQVVIGGTKLPAEQKRLQANPCQMLVATPGRLQDHIENTPGFSQRLKGVKVLILDEADHLLDMGFRKPIERIVAAVPKERQTLLFSATVPKEVHQVSQVALRREHEFINTVEEGSEETHSKVLQSSIVASHDSHFSLIYAILKGHVSEDPEYKVLVFCTTAMITRLVSEVLSELKLNVREIHSRKSQGYRTRVSDEFRKSKGLILITSDVSARGVDYPDVTLVIQVGIPSDREQYIHRLGRTGRKGKEGQGILLLAPWEEYFLKSVKDLPITKALPPTIDLEMNMKVKRALSHVDLQAKAAAYQAWLGYYNSVKGVGGDKSRLVQLANEFSRSMGLDTPPAIKKMTLAKMGLKNVPGLRSI